TLSLSGHAAAGATEASSARAGASMTTWCLCSIQSAPPATAATITARSNFDTNETPSRYSGGQDFPPKWEMGRRLSMARIVPATPDVRDRHLRLAFRVPD